MPAEKLMDCALSVVFMYVDKVSSGYTPGLPEGAMIKRTREQNSSGGLCDKPLHFYPDMENKATVSAVLLLMTFSLVMDSTPEYSHEKLMDSVIHLLFNDCNILYLKWVIHDFLPCSGC